MSNVRQTYRFVSLQNHVTCAGVQVPHSKGLILRATHYAAIRQYCHRRYRLHSTFINVYKKRHITNTHNRVSHTHLPLYALVVFLRTCHARGPTPLQFGLPMHLRGDHTAEPLTTRSTIHSIYIHIHNDK